MKAGEEFFNLYNHGFVRAAVAVPRVRVADPAFNAEQTWRELIARAARRRAVVVLFPELGLSAYSCDDLFHQHALLDGVRGGARRARGSRPRRVADRRRGRAAAAGRRPLFNCARRAAPRPRARRGAEDATCRTTASSTRRGSSPGRHALSATRSTCSARRRAVRRAAAVPGRGAAARFVLHVEICEDLWVPMPPSSYAALAGATVLAQPLGLEHHRRQGGLPAAARRAASRRAAWPPISTPPPGPGESTTDLAWDGHALIYENGDAAGRVASASREPQLITADIDLDRLRQERMRQTSFGDSRARTRRRAARLSAACAFRLTRRAGGRLAARARSSAFPTCRATRRARDERCAEVYDIQVQGLVKRLEPSGHRKRRDRRLRRPRFDAGAARLRAGDGPAQAAAQQHPRPTPCPASPPAARTLDQAHAADARARLRRAARSTSARLRCRCSRTSAIRTPRAGRSTTSPSRTCRPASAPATCSASPTCTGRWWSAPAICGSWRSAGAPTASATTCRTTTSTPACRRR